MYVNNVLQVVRLTLSMCSLQSYQGMNSLVRLSNLDQVNFMHGELSYSVLADLVWPTLIRKGRVWSNSPTLKHHINAIDFMVNDSIVAACILLHKVGRSIAGDLFLFL